MSYKIPLFDVNIGQDEIDAVSDTIRSGWISTGPKCDEFEKIFSNDLQVGYAISLANCTVALHLAVKILGVRKGDEVICPSLTFVATVNAIKYMEAIPVFADIESLATPVISARTIEPLITKKTKAIIVMHYAGFPCDMDSIMKLADKYNLKVIEDACHGPLSEYNGKKLGTIGDIGCFSFFSNKNISTGEGGMLVTNVVAYHDRAKLLRSHGMTTLSYQRSQGHAVSYDVVEPGYNYRMDDMRASIGIIQMSKISTDLRKRALVRKWYIERLKDMSKIIIPFKYHKGFYSNYIFPIILKNVSTERRNKVREEIHKSGIQTSMHYPPVHLFSSYISEHSHLNITESYGNQSITLPMYSKLTYDNVVYICDALKNIL